MRAVIEQFDGYVKLNRKIPPETVGTVSADHRPRPSGRCGRGATLDQDRDKQQLLELIDVTERLEKVFALMEGEIGMLQMERKIRNRVKRQMEKTQREYYLNEQMKAIQRELGDGDEDGRDEIGELEEKIKPTKLMSKEARDKAEAELKKLRQMSPMSAESTVVRNYLDWMVSLPWGKKKEDKRSEVARTCSNADHYGLEKVKERILEYLAVQARANKLKGPILCLVGPPGVGKTSLGKSIAKATGREFVRMSLGGVRDEAEIRGHRRTYIGSMPGKVIQSMKKAKKSATRSSCSTRSTRWARTIRGDPSSALLEVLDPEQNSTFNDHYLEVDYDLSDT
jgi:ATP-dependent Lon protease